MLPHFHSENVKQETITLGLTCPAKQNQSIFPMKLRERERNNSSDSIQIKFHWITYNGHNYKGQNLIQYRSFYINFLFSTIFLNCTIMATKMYYLF